jgi:PAS domain S-box-containing protein
MSEKHTTRRRYITGKLVQRPADLMSAFLDSSTTLLCAVDHKGEFVVFNRACERITGYSYEEMQGKSFFTLFAPSDQKILTETWAARFSSPDSAGEIDLPWVGRDGATHLIRWYFTRFTDALGNFEFYAAVGQDVTAKKRAEEALRESEERYRAMFERNRAIKFLIDPDTASIVEANPAACEYYGYTRERMQSMRISEVNTLPQEQILAEMARAKAQKRTHFQFKHRLASGEIRDVEVNSGPIEVRGRTLLYSIVHDITSRVQTEEALKASEARFRLLVEEATEAICIADGQGTNIEANSRACQLFGHTREEFAKMAVSDTVPPEDRALIGARFAQMKMGIPQRWERDLLRKDGKRFPVEISARFLPDGRLMAIMRDMTERKRAEEALRESESRFRQLADAAPVFIWLANAQGQRTYFSRGWTEFTGRSLDDEIGEGWLLGVHGEDSHRVSDMLADALQARQDFSIEYRLRASDGEFRWVLDHGVARFSESGQFSGFIGSCLDITERKRAENALRERERHYRELMEQSGDGIFIFDDKAHITDVNSRLCEILGYSRSEMLSINPTRLVDGSSQSRIPLRYGQMDAGETLRIETELICKDGRRVPLDISARRVGKGRYQAVLRDMTERRQTEEALRQSQQRYQAFIAQSTEGVWRFEFAQPVDVNLDIETQVDLTMHGGVLAECNDEMAKMYGYTHAEEIIGVRIAQLLDMSDLANREMFRVFAKARYRISDMESHEIGRDGAHHYFLNNVVGIIENEKLIRIWGTQREVTERRLAAQALAESEERFKRLASATEEAIIIHADGRVIDANARASEMSGYPMQELVGLDIRRITAPQSWENVQAAIASGFEGTNEYLGLRKDGSEFPCELTSRKIKLSGREVRVVAIRDITERKRAERALLESEDRYRRLSGATAEAILIHEQGRILDANQRASDMFGYAPGDLLNLLAFNLATPQTRQLVIENVRNGVEAPYEAVGLRRDGSTFPGEITARNLSLGGKQVRVVAIRDITERKRAEEALRREAGLVRLMQRVAMAANENSSSLAATRLCIDEICAYTGWPMGHAYFVDAKSGDLVPADIWHLDTPEIHAEFKNMNMAARFAPGVGLPGAVLHDRTPYWIEDIANDSRFPGGRTRTGLGILSGFAFPVLVGKEVVAVLEFGSAKHAPADAQLLEIMGNIGTQLGRVVERERANELLEARVAERTAQLEHANRELSRRAIDLESINKELEAFSYSVSHDLRAPLRGIFGFSQALQEDFAPKLGEDGGAMLERIKSASQRMGRLIDDLLGLSRVTRAEMVRESVDLSAMATEICTELRRVYPNRRIDIEIQPAVNAVGDARMLRILLQNLLDNAFKFTARKENARIEFKTEQTEQGLAYTVSDNGAGFEMQYAQKLFGAFQRLHSMKEFEGTGIGLATVQRIVHRHGGRVRAKGAPGEGASIQFTLGTGDR